MSVITLKKKRKMLFIPLDFEKVQIDALVNSEAYINVLTEIDAGKKEKESNAFINE